VPTGHRSVAAFVNRAAIFVNRVVVIVFQAFAVLEDLLVFPIVNVGTFKGFGIVVIVVFVHAYIIAEGGGVVKPQFKDSGPRSRKFRFSPSMVRIPSLAKGAQTSTRSSIARWVLSSVELL